MVEYFAGSAETRLRMKRSTFVGVRGDMVVIMGEEVLRPNKDAPHVGKTISRGSTDVWKPFDGVWKLWIRQATITKAE